MRYSKGKYMKKFWCLELSLGHLEKNKIKKWLPLLILPPSGKFNFFIPSLTYNLSIFCLLLLASSKRARCNKQTESALDKFLTGCDYSIAHGVVDFDNNFPAFVKFESMPSPNLTNIKGSHQKITTFFSQQEFHNNFCHFRASKNYVFCMS